MGSMLFPGEQMSETMSNSTEGWFKRIVTVLYIIASIGITGYVWYTEGWLTGIQCIIAAFSIWLTLIGIIDLFLGDKGFFDTLYMIMGIIFINYEVGCFVLLFKEFWTALGASVVGFLYLALLIGLQVYLRRILYL